MKATPKQKEGYVIESLSRQEIARIRKMTLGYGNFRKAVDKAGLPYTTFRDILNKGYGIPENIQQIRNGLLEAEPAKV